MILPAWYGAVSQSPAVQTQFFTDFSEYATGSAPSDWTVRDSSTVGWEVQSKFDSQVLTALATGSSSAPENQRRFISWDAPGENLTFEVVYLYEIEDAGAKDRHARIYARADGDPQNEDAYELRASGGVLRRIIAGSATSLADITPTGLDAAATPYCHRLRIETLENTNVRIRTKAWQPNDINDVEANEPASWDIDHEDDHADRITAEGFTGVGCQGNQDFEIYWRFVGVGVGGAAAPTSEVS